MSAKNAADALMEHDADLSAQVRALVEGRDAFAILAEERATVIRQMAGSWTLALAARAAGVEEKQVLVAFTRHHLHYGMNPASQALVEAALANRI